MRSKHPVIPGARVPSRPPGQLRGRRGAARAPHAHARAPRAARAPGPRRRRRSRRAIRLQR